MQRFLSGFEEGPEDACWLWNATLDKDGYGVIKIDNKMLKAHRLSYEYYNGEPPTNECIRHLCGTKRCMNPSHLKDDTKKANRWDQMRLGEDARLRVTQEDVNKIRQEWKDTVFSKFGDKKKWIEAKAKECGVTSGTLEGYVYAYDRISIPPVE